MMHSYMCKYYLVIHTNNLVYIHTDIYTYTMHTYMHICDVLLILWYVLF